MASAARKLPIYPAVLGFILAVTFAQAATAQQSSSFVGGPDSTSLTGIWPAFRSAKLCLAAAQSLRASLASQFFVCAINHCSEAIRKTGGGEQSDDNRSYGSGFLLQRHTVRRPGALSPGVALARTLESGGN